MGSHAAMSLIGALYACLNLTQFTHNMLLIIQTYRITVMPSWSSCSRVSIRAQICYALVLSSVQPSDMEGIAIDSDSTSQH